jgi:hypothetical protein
MAAAMIASRTLTPAATATGIIVAGSVLRREPYADAACARRKGEQKDRPVSSHGSGLALHSSATGSDQNHDRFVKHEDGDDCHDKEEGGQTRRPQRQRCYQGKRDLCVGSMLTRPH